MGGMRRSEWHTAQEAFSASPPDLIRSRQLVHHGMLAELGLTRLKNHAAFCLLLHHRCGPWRPEAGERDRGEPAVRFPACFRWSVGRSFAFFLSASMT